MTHKALLVDYGGVLTTSVRTAYEGFCATEGIDLEEFRDVLRQAYYGGGNDHPLVALELGLIERETFERDLAAQLSKGLKKPLSPINLTARIFGMAEPDHKMVEAVRRLRARGVRCGLLSNSLGDTDYSGVLELFDVTVISGEVGLRKPDPAIFKLALDKIGFTAAQVVFVDDARPNTQVADSLGITTILHHNSDITTTRLEELFS